MSSTHKFFVDNGHRRLAELDLTVDEWYALFKQRLAEEEQAKFEASWPTLGTQP